MEERTFFRFSIPPTPKGPLVELSYQEAEKLLLKRLDDPSEDTTDTLWQLAHFYKVNRRHEKALERLRQLMDKLPAPEEKAACVFTMGQAMEKVNDFANAARYYQEAFAMEPTNTFTWYFIHNNLGYCLCQTNQFERAEGYCRKAVEIDPNRPNGHKNLGIALSGQGRHREAAEAFIAATKANAADPRAYGLLDRLIKQHPELEFEFKNDLECCQKAVEVVAKKLQAARPVVLRGWRKQLVLLKARLKSGFQKRPGKPSKPQG